MSRSNDFHRMADEARDLAARTSEPKAKAQWLLIAAEWRKLAETAEKLDSK